MNEIEEKQDKESEFADRVFSQMWELEFAPEISRRRLMGEINDDFILYSAQLLQPPDGKKKILFNEQVRGVALLRAPRDIQAGESITLADLSCLEQFDLPDDLLDCGHFTIIRKGEGWLIAFNFLSGRAKAREMLGLADQYLHAAIESAKRGHAGPAIDNLFSSSELISKAELILHRRAAAKAKTHTAIEGEILKWARLGNIDQDFAHLYKRLREQRPFARYSDRGHMPPMPEEESFNLVREMIDRGIDKITKSVERTQKDTE